jgi:hypothetical protein
MKLSQNRMNTIIATNSFDLIKKFENILNHIDKRSFIGIIYL